MKQKNVYMWILGGASLAALFAAKPFFRFLRPFLMQWEGYRQYPYWDIKQWSWGYGTRVPGSVNDPTKKPAGSITQAQAIREMERYNTQHWEYLRKLIKTPLGPQSWAALLSFAYNLGPGNADNLTANINLKAWGDLETQWYKYILVNGIPNDTILERRKAEFRLFKQGIPLK